MNHKITTLAENCVYRRKLQTEHDLSLYIGAPENRLLFNTGASDLFIRNARLLNIGLQKVDCLVLSHGHGDHTGELRHFLEPNAEAAVVCKRGVFFSKFRGECKNGVKYTRSLDFSRFRSIDELTELVPGVSLFPSVDIIGQKDTHLERFWIQEEDGSRVPDTLPGKLAIVLVEPERLSILSACSHRGIASILRTVRTASPELPCNLLLGGFHVRNAEESKYQVITDYLHGYLPQKIDIYHCTGVDKYTFFYKDFGDRIFYNRIRKLTQTDSLL